MPLSSKRVLVVEDDHLQASDFAATLTVAGAVVLGPVPDCARAFEVLRRERVDAAVLDLKLGEDETCYPVAEYCHDKRIPFMFVSGYEHSNIRPEFAKRAFVSKPVGGAKLVAAVELLTA